MVRDKELKLQDGEASHTLGGAGEGVPKEREVNRRRFFFYFERQESRPLEARKGVGMRADSCADIKDWRLAQTSQKRKGKYLVLFSTGVYEPLGVI